MAQERLISELFKMALRLGGRFSPLVQNGLAQNGVTTSSNYNQFHDHRACFLDAPVRPHGSAAWCSQALNQDQWIKVDLGKEVSVCRVATQGRGDCGQWVKSYRLEHSQDNITWTPVGQQFQGNTDQTSIVYHTLEVPVLVRFVRLCPLEWHSHLSLRFELYTLI